MIPTHRVDREKLMHMTQNKIEYNGMPMHIYDTIVCVAYILFMVFYLCKVCLCIEESSLIFFLFLVKM